MKTAAPSENKTAEKKSGKRRRKTKTEKEFPPTRPYITCKKRKGNPRIPLEVCMVCPYHKKCAVYFEERNPSLF